MEENRFLKNHGLLTGIVLSATLLVAVASGTADDYFDQITVFSDGRITRFVEMPIIVYISPMLRTEAYLSALRYAMREWEAVSDGKIQFQESEVSEGTDIRVSWAGGGLMTVTDTPLAKTELTRLTTTDFRAEIILVLRGLGTMESSSPEKIRTVCLHELGHAIGLWGHSPDRRDVSFFAATAGRPTARDRATLLKVYATPAGAPQHDVAISVMKKRIEANPNQPHTYYLLGAIYVDKGDVTSAIASFKTCLDLDPNSQGAKEKLLQAYQESGRQQEAIKMLEGMLNQEASPEGYNTAGVMYYQSGEIEKSTAAFQKAIEINPYYQTARNNLYQIFREQGFTALNTKEVQKAEKYFQKALQFNPRDAALCRLMGDGYARRGDFKNAIAQYQKAFQFNPTDREIKGNLARYWSNYGVQLADAQRWEIAISAYHRAIALMPTLTVARANLIDTYWRRANAHRESGDVDVAIRAYQALFTFDPRAADVHSLLGELYLKKGEYLEAIRAFQSALDAAPDDGQSLRNLVAAHHSYAQHLDHHKRYDEAIEMLRRALMLSPKHPNLRLSLANVYQHAGDFERAREELAKILEDAPHDLEASREAINLRIARGNALMNVGEYTAALAQFEAIKEPAKSAEIYNTIGYLHLMANRPILAITAFESALATQPMDNVAYQNLLAIESQFDRQLSDEGDSQRIKNDLARVRNSLTVCHINRQEHVDALAKYRSALDLDANDPLVRAALIDTGVRLAQEFQEKNWSQRVTEVMRWVQEFDADNPTVKSARR